MDKKYIGGNVALSKETLAALDIVHEKIRQRLGFSPSRQDVIKYLINYFQTEGADRAEK